jgi:tRNA-uridine 2-sulfurtransferase
MIPTPPAKGTPETGLAGAALEASVPVQPVVVAMSGGVDSSVAAALLLRAGHPVIGVTLRLQECHQVRGSRSCCGAEGIARARAVAGRLGIAHYVVDCVSEFEEQVLRPAWNDYAQARTPSPCLLCNERIKFGVLLSWARQLGAPRVATGHYARITLGPRGEPSLLRGKDPDKDQSYFLAGLQADQLRSVLFPIGHLHKQEVRGLARSLGLPSADTRESQDACLVGLDQSFAEMLRERFHAESRPGPIVDEDGRVLGQHRGIHRYTVGQRRGLGISSTGRCWVKAVCPNTAAVIITHDERALLASRLEAKGMNWIGTREPDGLPSSCQVQIRYRHAPAIARLEIRGEDSLGVVFEKPVRAITPGQAAVFYDGARVLGRGWIQAAG